LDPSDAVGWDGYVYPWTFCVHDFGPITGRIHQQLTEFARDLDDGKSAYSL
jgi:homogentisate 1,2-dioxygenase